MLSTSITAITEDLYDQMVERATERIRDSLTPAIPEASELRPESVEIYARRIISGISEVKDLIYVMLKGDDGIFLRQLTDLIFEKNLANSLSFYGGQDSEELRLFYEFLSAGMAAFIIKWVVEDGMSENRTAALLAGILLQPLTKMPEHLISL